MTFARILWPLAATATLAACSGNLGGGQSSLPGAPPAGSNVQQVAPPPATATPSSASNVATIGDNISPQALPNILGWGGSIAFPKPSPAPTGSPNPKATAAAAAVPAPAAVSIGVTASVVEPADVPPFGPGSAKRRGKRDPGSNTPLLFVSLLATADVTLGTYPKLAFDVPRDVAAKHADDTYALALFDPGQKEKVFRLAVAERDLSSPEPGGVPSPAGTPIPTPIPTPVGNGPQALTPPPVGDEAAGAGLPPDRIAFAPTASALVLKANRPVVFALYAIPPQPSPSPSASASEKAASAAGSAVPSVRPSASPASASSAAAPSPAAGSPQPAASNGSP